MVRELIAVRQAQIFSLILQRKENSRDLSNGQAAYLLMEERTRQFKWENFTQCNSNKI